jgi:predicted Holliday junction resolvase-like endonuclease
MADWFPSQAGDAVKEYHSRPDIAKEQYLKLRRELVTTTGERSVRVKVGQVLEQIVPALPTFPYAGNDCRSLFKPIDYVVFEGLTQNEVDSIHFVDVKTGHARMNDHQKEIRRIIDKKRVEFERY